jgi:hypothetical protein
MAHRPCRAWAEPNSTCHVLVHLAWRGSTGLDGGFVHLGAHVAVEKMSCHIFNKKSKLYV